VIKAATIMSIQLRLMACILALAAITVAQEPKTVSGYIQTAVAYQRAGKHRETLSQVLVMDPDHSEARERLRVSTVRKNLFPPLETLKRNVVERPESAEARAELADAYKAFGMYAEAEQEFKKVLELEPGNVDFKLLLCVDYAEWGKVDPAVECYKEVVKLKQHHVLYWGLGTLYEKQGNVEEAIRHIRSLSSLSRSLLLLFIVWH
jgi:tetratricopeptide (TPR) repeat protein